MSRLRLASTVVTYWHEGRLHLENYFTGNRITAAPLIVAVLDFFARWRSRGEFYSEFGQYERASLARAIRQLLLRNLLLRENSAAARHDEQLQKAWAPWLPAAGMLQFGTRNARYESNLEAVRRQFRHLAEKISPPPSVKHYPSALNICLPRSKKTDPFPQILLSRRTWRRFSKRHISLNDLATLLDLSWGVQRWVKFPGIGRLALKTSPSAGARHPIEVYVLAVGVEDLPPGVYHYAADKRRLELVKKNANRRDIASYLGNQWWYARAAALMLMTAVFPRNQWKYRDSPAYRTVMIDAGHVCQTFCLVATWLGLAPFCTMAFDQVLVERELGIDGVKESLIYAAGVGSRPPGVKWAPWPRPSSWRGVIGS